MGKTPPYSSGVVAVRQAESARQFFADPDRIFGRQHEGDAAPGLLDDALPLALGLAEHLADPGPLQEVENRGAQRRQNEADETGL